MNTNAWGRALLIGAATVISVSTALAASHREAPLIAQDPAADGSNCGQPCAELLRLDLRVPPTAPEKQSRLGAALSADPAGYPNGRRPNDDVTDITIRVAGGKNFIAAHAGDGVNFLEGAPGTVGVDITANGIARNFPFLPTPYDGKNRRHIDCGEPGGNPCGPLVP